MWRTLNLPRGCTAILDARARLDARDDLLKNGPCTGVPVGTDGVGKAVPRAGADPVESDAEAWVTPPAPAREMEDADIAREPQAVEIRLNGASTD
jgi:hypothetical protein